jgi:hypothetical protein
MNVGRAPARRCGRGRQAKSAASDVRSFTGSMARDLGAGRLACFAAAYMPVLKPGILAPILFIQSIEEFAISFVLGPPDFTTVPTILYSYLGHNFIRPNAAAVSLIPVVPNVLLMLLFERLLKSEGAVTVGAPSTIRAAAAPAAPSCRRWCAPPSPPPTGRPARTTPPGPG